MEMDDVEGEICLKEKYVRVIRLSSLIKIVCTLNIKMEYFLMQILTGKDIGSTLPVLASYSLRQAL